MQIKPLFIIDNLNTGGAQRQMVNLAIELTLRGYPVEFFCYSPGDLLAKPLNDSNIPINWYIKKSRFSIDVVLALRSLIITEHFNLILSFLPTPNFYAILAARFLIFRRIPVIVSERRCDLPHDASIIKWLTRQFYRFASHVVTNSYHQRADLKSKYPWIKKRISTIYNGYDLEKFFSDNTLPNNQPIRLLVISRVSPHKNGICLIEALNLLKRYDHLFPQVDWIGQHVPKGIELEYLTEMKRLIDDYELTNQWHWLNQRTDIVNQIHMHDALVHPSFGEGLPNVVCETLSCSRPVILSNLLDHSRLVQHGISGYLFDYKDPSDLAKKIKMFINLTQIEKRKMGQQGRKYAEMYLSVGRLADQYEKLFSSVVNE